MLLKTILNRCLPVKGFVYQEVAFSETQENTIDVLVRHRKGSKPYCSGCGKKCSGYDHLPERRFEFIPFWGLAVFLVYARRRVNCKQCGVVAEMLPWAEGKRTLTNQYMQFLAFWARKLSWKDVAETFDTTWDKVFVSIKWIVDWGLEHRSLEGVKSIGVDEIAYNKGHKYLTLVYQIDSGAIRLLWVGKERTIETFGKFFDMIGEKLTSEIEFVCSDMWRPYLNVIRNRCSQALHVLDRFHIVKKLNEAVDTTRSEEAGKLNRNGYEPVLKKSRWCLLKKTINLTTIQKGRLKELLSYNLKTVRAYLLKEDFNHFWEYQYPACAGKFLDLWCNNAMRSKLDSMKKVAKMLRKHRELLLNWFKAKGELSSGVVEGLNNKAKVTMRKSYGFKNPEILEMALLHGLGKLPEPKLTHKLF